jgi:hypothetical protein
MQAICLPCPASYVCDQSSMRSPTICPAGFYCPAVTITPLPCPVGTFSKFVGLNAISQCQPCDSGKYCKDEGMSSTSGYCNAGFYCDRTTLSGVYGFTRPDPPSGVCPVGSYCPSGTISPLLCPPGKYSDVTGLVDVNGCKPCLVGYICPSYGITSVA